VVGDGAARPALASRLRFGVVRAPILRLLGRTRLLRPAFRVYEAALTARARRRGPAPDDGLPLPPPALIVRVAGTGDTAWFLESGRLAAEAIRDALRGDGAEIGQLRAILDFGCGCGRVTRRWAGLRGVSVYGSDRDERAIEWSRRNLPFAEFETNGLAPPLVFEDASFDLVYALSVLTHLPEELQRLWLRELHRVLRPGGRLLVTTHGEHYLPKLDKSERARFEAGELVVRRKEAAGTNLCAAYHPRSYVEHELLPPGFELAEFVEEGAKGNPAQDLYLARRK
jgi:SAM-dependent methyltransferase